MTKKQKNELFRIILAGVIFFVCFIGEKTGLLDFSKVSSDGRVVWLVSFAIYLIPYLIVGFVVIKKAIINIGNGQVFDENFLMCIATFGALGIGEFDEAVAVMLFYKVGELFENIAVNRSRQSIADMMDMCPEYANLEEDGEVTEVDPDDVEVGSIIVIKPGEKVPLDGVIVEGDSYLDTSALTGESVPRHGTVGDEVLSGCINGSNLIKVRTTKEFDDSTITKILELVEDASTRKAQVEKFITKFAKYYTPIVVIVAALLAIIPPIFVGNWGEWIKRGCIFLVISCPCALVISVPLSFFGGVGACSRNGILVKGCNYIEMLASLRTLVFDKTGTLTKGEFEVTEICGEDKKEILYNAALIEKNSSHPIAQSVIRAYNKVYGENYDQAVTDVSEEAGHGISGTIDGKRYYVGNQKLLEKHGINPMDISSDILREYSGSTLVYVAKADRCIGCIFISDKIKDGIDRSLEKLRVAGVGRFAMLTGDKSDTAEAVAGKIGIDDVYAELLPTDKVSNIEKIIENQNEDGFVGFVGDGINDAPVISRADIGIAMGAMGSDAAIEAADIVLMEDDIDKLERAIRIAKRTMVIVKQNIVFALVVKFAILILGAVGLANMWLAVFADVGVAVLAILNAMRTGRK